jgi:hypothetical protein
MRKQKGNPLEKGFIPRFEEGRCAVQEKWNATLDTPQRKRDSAQPTEAQRKRDSAQPTERSNNLLDKNKCLKKVCAT